MILYYLIKILVLNIKSFFIKIFKNKKKDSKYISFFLIDNF